MTTVSSPSRLLLISCPGTRAQREGRFPEDEQLDERALQALARIAWRPPESHKLWVSPEIRTLETAQALSLNAEAAPALCECDYGRWRGRALDDLLQEDADGLSAWLSDVTAVPHGGESFDNAMTRVGAWLQNHPSGVAITHGSVVRSAIVHALSAPRTAFLQIEIAPLTLTDLRFSRGQWTVRAAGIPLACCSGVVA